MKNLKKTLIKRDKLDTLFAVFFKLCQVIAIFVAMALFLQFYVELQK